MTSGADKQRPPINWAKRRSSARSWRSLQKATMSAAIIGAFFLAVAYALYRFQVPGDYRLYDFEFPEQSKWIAAEGDYPYAGFFRKEMHFHANVKHAWVMVAPYQGFEVSVNGNMLSRFFLWRSTRPFQNGLMEVGQRVATDLPSMGLNYPREYQWTNHRNHILPVFIDLTNSLRLGRNVICFELESRHAPARVRFTGCVELVTGEKIEINSDESFQAYQVPRGQTHRNWNSNAVMKLDWPPAKIVEAPGGSMFRHVPTEAYTTPFQGEWMFSANRQWETDGRWAGSKRPQSYYYQIEWNVPDTPQEAYVRVFCNRPYYIFVNDRLVDPRLPYSKTRTGDEWIVNSKPPTPRGPPELLDPDETGNLFVGTRFENPRHGDPTENEYRRMEISLNQTSDRPFQNAWAEMPGSYVDPQKGFQHSFDPKGPIVSPEAVVPRALTRNAEDVTYRAYGIANLLKEGANRIVVRATDDPLRDEMGSGAPRLAADVGVVGVRGEQFMTHTGKGWTLHVGGLDQPSHPAITYPLPKKPALLEFRGHARVASGRKWKSLLHSLLGAAAVVIAYWGTFRLIVARFHVQYLVPSILAVVGAVLLQATMKENHEVVHFLMERTWAWIAVGVILLPILLLVTIHVVRSIRLSRLLRSPLERIGEKFDQSADRQRWIAWPILLVLLCFCTFVRAYNVDFQTLDDDEYASVQAALAVAETGTPVYPNGIYYSRSPLHHYLAGATVWLFGGNVWVLRMGPILLGVGTGWMMYLIGSQILGSRWIGLGALFVYSLHPFLIFSSHIARFYQQQQFFAVLVFYFFYFGFVKWGRPFHRYATIWAFSAAIQSQEISAVLGLSMLLGFVAFSHFVKTSEIIKLAIHAACLIGCLAVDFAAFQLICLTRLEGVSPNVEASVKPNFTYALNLLAMFVTYGRVHLTLSVFVLIGIAYGVKRRDKGFLFLALMAFSGILFAVTFITGVSLRYQYWIIAPWILMSVYGLAGLCHTLGRLQRDASSYANLKILSATVLTSVLVLSFSPWRTVGSYHVKILGDATGAMQYVAANLRPGDKVGATEPHPHAALLETGRSDFDIAFPLLWDFTHKDEQGYTLDRNGGARVIGSMADLQLACANNDRIFFCINREKFRSRGKNIRWEYPSARAELFFRENCMLVHRSYLWSVYLWDKNRGTYEAFRSESP